MKSKSKIYGFEYNVRRRIATVLKRTVIIPFAKGEFFYIKSNETLLVPLLAILNKVSG